MVIRQRLRRRVWERANSCCEYCHMPQPHDPILFEIDHVIPEKLRGPTTADNLALACFPCNNHKGTNIAGIDPQTKQRAYLHNPRKETWSQHFAWDGARLRGLTPTGRATIDMLQINRPDRVVVRQSLIDEGVFPMP